MVKKSLSKDQKFFLVVLVVTSIITILPYLVGVGLTPTQYLFQGNTVLAPGDPNVYYSYIEQARQGAFFMRDVFTSEPHAATLWQPVWLVLGWLANLLHISTPAAFALGRVLSMVLFLFTLRWALQFFWTDHIIRRVALLTVLGASGLGWAYVLLTQLNTGDLLLLPPDLWVSELTPMISAWATPHFLVVTSGYLFVLTSVEILAANNSWRRWWLVGLVGLVTLSIHPFHLFTWVMFWVARTVWQWTRAKKFPSGYVCRWATVILFCTPAIFYYLLGIVADPIIIERARQNINLTPDWWLVAIGLGILPVLAFYGWRSMHRQQNVARVWLTTWAIVQLAVIFFPFSGQRRLMQALVLPFALLSAPFLVEIWQRWGRMRLGRVALLGSLFPLMSGSIFFSGNWIVHDYQLERRGRDNWEYFLSPDYQSLFTYLKTHTEPQQPIIASLWDSNLIAGFTARTVVIGHPVETLGYNQKIAKIKHFYQDATATEQQHIIQELGACYVLDGRRERAYGQALQPTQIPSLHRVWIGSTMALYRTTDCELGG